MMLMKLMICAHLFAPTSPPSHPPPTKKKKKKKKKIANFRVALIMRTN